MMELAMWQWSRIPEYEGHSVLHQLVGRQGEVSLVPTATSGWFCPQPNFAPASAP